MIRPTVPLASSLFTIDSFLAAPDADGVLDARAGRRGPQRLPLPTWSQLSVATRQRNPHGHGGDFFEIVQHRDGQVSTVLADVCGNGPSAAGPVSRLRWLLRQHLARGESPGGVLSVLNDAIVAIGAPE